tara:strand:+ start:29 stop:436 length:408 start_codon:yes stop_codon:yes gene_type:complete
MDIRQASYLLPDPGGEVVRELLDKIQTLTADRHQLMTFIQHAAADLANEKKISSSTYNQLSAIMTKHGWNLKENCPHCGAGPVSILFHECTGHFEDWPCGSKRIQAGAGKVFNQSSRCREEKDKQERANATNEGS